MKTPLFSIIAVSLAAGIVSADVPAKPPLATYSKLWTDSVLCSAPEPSRPPGPDQAMADWALGGVSEIKGGYMITLFHRKNAGESMIIRPGGVQKITAGKIERGITPGEAGTFKLDRVEFGKGGWREISVHLSGRSGSGVVRFDEKDLMPKAPAPPAGHRPAANVHPYPANPQAAPGTPVREARPRGTQAPKR